MKSLITDLLHVYINMTTSNIIIHIYRDDV